MAHRPPKTALNRITPALLVVLVLIAFMVFAIVNTTACRKQSAREKLQDRPNTIAFIGAGQDDPVWPVLRAGAERYVAEFGLKNVLIDAPQRATPTEQIELLRTLPGRGFRGVCVQVTNPVMYEPIVRWLCDSGLRVVTMVHDTAEDVRSGFCGLDNIAIGRKLAEATEQVVGDQGNIIVIHAGEKHPWTGQRYWAFRQAIDPFAGIRTYFWMDCGASPAEAARLIREYDERYPNLDAYVSLDAWPLRYFGNESAPKPGRRKLISFGATPIEWPRIQDGTCAAMVEADYSQAGFRAIRMCDKAIQDKALRVQRVLLPLEIITPDTLDDFRIQWVSWSAPPTEMRSGHGDAADDNN